MPTMKDIAEALRDASFYAEQYVRQGGGNKKDQAKAASFYLNLASKVEQMRCCETCRYWTAIKGDTDCASVTRFNADNGANIRGCGPNFFCPHWRAKKEVKNG